MDKKPLAERPSIELLDEAARAWRLATRIADDLAAERLAQYAAEIEAELRRRQREGDS